MAETYTEKKLQVQQRFRPGSLASYAGQRTVLRGTVKIVGHEKQGGIIVEVDGITATVSPFTLTPLGTAPPRAEPKKPPKALRPKVAATIFRNGVPVPQDRQVEGEPVQIEVPRQEAPPPRPCEAPTRPVKLEGLRAVAPTPAQCEALFATWLRAFRWKRSRAHRQAIIDGFVLPTWLRERVPTPPTPEAYKQVLYYTAAALLQHPHTLPPPTEALDLIAQRFPVDKVAVNAHCEWLMAKLDRDHAKFLAGRAAVGVDA